MALETSKQNRFARLLNSRKRRDHYNEINDQPADIADTIAEGDEYSRKINERPYEIEKVMAEGARRSQETNQPRGTSDVYSDKAKGEDGSRVNLPPPLAPAGPASQVYPNQKNESRQKRQLDANKKQDKNQLKTKANSGKAPMDEIMGSKAPFNKTTGQLLKQSWLNLIDSFGLTLLWIHAHALLSKVFAGKVFGPLGSEWVPQEIINKGGDELRAKIKKFGLIEWIILLFIDFILFLAILFIIGFLGMLAYYFFHPLQIVRDMGTEALAFIWALLFPK